MIPDVLELGGSWPIAYTAGGALVFGAFLAREVRAGLHRTARARRDLASCSDLFVPAGASHTPASAAGPVAPPSSLPGPSRDEQPDLDELREQRRRLRADRRLAGERAARAAVRPAAVVEVTYLRDRAHPTAVARIRGRESR